MKSSFQFPPCAKSRCGFLRDDLGKILHNKTWSLYHNLQEAIIRNIVHEILTYVNTFIRQNRQYVKKNNI